MDSVCSGCLYLTVYHPSLAARNNASVVGRIDVFVRCVRSDHFDRPAVNYIHYRVRVHASKCVCVCVCQLAVSRISPGCFKVCVWFRVLLQLYFSPTWSVTLVRPSTSLFFFFFSDVFMTLLLTQTPLTCSCSRCITDTPTALTSEQKMLILHTHTHTYS